MILNWPLITDDDDYDSNEVNNTLIEYNFAVLNCDGLGLVLLEVWIILQKCV